MPLLFKNIKELIQVRKDPISLVAGEEMKILPTIERAYLLIDNDIIVDFGKMVDCPQVENVEEIDASGQMILPAWCDSHTHLVYAGNREGEFVDRINGLSYEEIALRGGGILNSAKKLQEISEEALFEESKVRLEEIMRLGTGAVEIKSGYGLTPASELKMLRVIKRLNKEYPITIAATFLGAHAVPANYKGRRNEYINMLITDVLPEIARENLAQFIDIFCEENYFTIEDTAQLLEAGKSFGLSPKIHVNQFNAIGGVQVGVKYDALSVDHLEVMRKEDIEVLKNSNTMPVALPACSFFLGIPYTPAREIIAAGLPLAVATDYNPGSSPTGNMNFVLSTACIKLKMTPEEAINAATLNGAYAMGMEKDLGSISVGKKANILLTKPINSYGALPYAFGSNYIDQVYLEGRLI